jgi:hypothetical protein
MQFCKVLLVLKPERCLPEKTRTQLAHLSNPDMQKVAGLVDRNANPLEILYNVIDEDILNVFHAMKCRNIYIPLIQHKEE